MTPDTPKAMTPAEQLDADIDAWLDGAGAHDVIDLKRKWLLPVYERAQKADGFDEGWRNSERSYRDEQRRANAAEFDVARLRELLSVTLATFHDTTCGAGDDHDSRCIAAHDALGATEPLHSLGFVERPAHSVWLEPLRRLWREIGVAALMAQWRREGIIR